MFNELASKIKSLLTEQQAENAKTFTDLVFAVVDETVEETTGAKHLAELRKSPEEFESAVACVAEDREYGALCEQTGSPRLELISLDKPVAEIRQHTELLRHCIKELRIIVTQPEAEAREKGFLDELQSARDAHDHAEKNLSQTHERLKGKIAQARSDVSRCNLAAGRLAELYRKANKAPSKNVAETDLSEEYARRLAAPYGDKFEAGKPKPPISNTYLTSLGVPIDEAARRHITADEASTDVTDDEGSGTDTPGDDAGESE